MPSDETLNVLDLANFTDHAKERLNTASREYLRQIVDECFRIEAAENSAGGPTEITHVIVNTAVFQSKRVPSKKKAGWGLTIRLASHIMLFLAGILWMPDSFSQGYWLIGFVVALIVAISLTTASFFMED
jgi:hypothetical protein